MATLRVLILNVLIRTTLRESPAVSMRRDLGHALQKTDNAKASMHQGVGVRGSLAPDSLASPNRDGYLTFTANRTMSNQELIDNDLVNTSFWLSIKS